MEQPEIPAPHGAVPLPAPPPAPPEDEPAAKVELPDPKGALPIPDQFRLPFKGKVSPPTAVPSGTQRRFNLDRIQKRRRRRSFLSGLLVGQILIIGLDVGGPLYLRYHPSIKLQADFGVPSVVFLGMAAGAAVMIAAVGLIHAVLALGTLRGKRRVPIGSGFRQMMMTVLALGVSIGVILGTSWFMIPPADWKPTVSFARNRSAEALGATTSKLRSLFSPAPRTR